MSTEIQKQEEGKQLQKQTKAGLPSLDELHYDVQLAFKNDQLNLLLNQDPPASWIKEHPIVKREVVDQRGVKVKVPALFLPIDHIEFLLTRIFQQWRVEILREGALFNSVYCTIRLHYLHPISGQWLYHDGTGAVGVQTDAGKPASDLGAIKQAAIQMALPAAKFYAIKDACELLGKLFGKDLNRNNSIEFAMGYNIPAAHARQEEYPEAVPNAEVDPNLITLQDYELLKELMNNPGIKDKFHYVQWLPQVLYNKIENDMANGAYMTKEMFEQYKKLLEAEIAYSAKQEGGE